MISNILYSETNNEKINIINNKKINIINNKIHK